MESTKSLTETYTHLPLRHWHTLVIVTDTHQHIHRGFYTWMTSYLPQAYRLSKLIDKQTLFINSWLIRLSIDNVLLINTRRLSILIDKSIPLSIGVSTFLLISFKLSSGCLFIPHHVNQGGVQKATPQVTLYESHTAEESLRRRRSDRYSQVLTGHAGQAREFLHVLLPPHQRVCVKGHLMYSRVTI